MSTLFSKSLLLFATLFVGFSLAAETQCYWKGGGLPPANTNFQPCFPSDSSTHCCDDGQTCLSNGLCLVKWDTSINTGACTDSTWTTTTCFQGCDEFATLYRCSDNKWCCSAGGNVTNCCRDPDVSMITIPGQALIQNGSAFIPDYTIALTADISNKTTDSAAPRTSANSSSTSPTSSDASDSRTLAAGLGAGLGIGIPLLVVIGFLSFLLARDKAKIRNLRERLSNPGLSAPVYVDDRKKDNIAEVNGNGVLYGGRNHLSQRSELAYTGETRPAELQS